MRACPREVLEGERPEYRVEFRIRHPQKGLRWVLGIGRAFHNGHSRPARLSGLNIDITAHNVMEVALSDVRRHLGVETQRQWSDLAILRTTPALLDLFALITLWADRLAADRGVQPDSVRWYRKAEPTFNYAPALVGRELWTAPTFATSRQGRDNAEIPTKLLDRLIRVACRPP